MRGLVLMSWDCEWVGIGGGFLSPLLALGWGVFLCFVD